MIILGTLALSCPNPGGETPDPGSLLPEKTPAIKVSASAVITSGSEITFPGVKIHESGNMTITIENSGETSLNLTGTPAVKLEGNTDIFEIAGQPATTTLAKNEKTTFILRFKPVDTERVSAGVFIPNSGKNAPDFRFTVSGQGRKELSAAIKVSAFYIGPDGSDVSTEIGKDTRITNAFTNVYVDEKDDMLITIENTGGQALHLTGTPPNIITTSSTVFKISSQPDKTELAPGEKTTFTLRFEPNHANKATVDVVIANTSENAPDFIFTVEGQGKSKTPEIKLFNEKNEEIAREGTVSLGDTLISTPVMISLTIKNTGKAPLQLTGEPLIAISGDNTSGFTVVTLPVKDISVNGSTSFQIKFDPAGEGELGSAVTIKNNTNTDFKFFISGKGVIPKPVIAIFYGSEEKAQHGEINLGSVRITESKTADITIKNTGDEPLIIQTGEITFTGDDAGAFSIVTMPAANVAVQGQPSSFTIRYTASGNGEKSVFLRIPNNDTARNPAILLIKGVGIGMLPPQNVKAQGISASEIMISWDPIQDAAGYSVYRSLSAEGDYTKINTGNIAGTVSSYTDTGLTAASTYYYRVSAAGGGEESVKSAAAPASAWKSSGVSVTVPVSGDVTVSASPASIAKGGTITLQVSGMQGTAYQWYLDGGLINEASASGYVLSTAALTPGVHELTAVVTTAGGRRSGNVYVTITN